MSIPATFQTQLASVMDLLAKAVVVEMEKLFDDCLSCSVKFRLKMCSQNQKPNSQYMDSEFRMDRMLSVMKILTKEAMEKINKLLDKSPAMMQLEMIKSETMGRAVETENTLSCSFGVQVGEGCRTAGVSEEYPPTSSLKSDGEPSSVKEETSPRQCAIMRDKSPHMEEQNVESLHKEEGRPGDDVPNDDLLEPLTFRERNAVKSSADAGETFSNEHTERCTEAHSVQPTTSESHKECISQPSPVKLNSDIGITHNSHQVVHTGDKPYSCMNCGKGFTAKHSLNVHQRTVHDGERMHSCDKCGKSYGTKSDLKVHQRLHTGENPYQCFECGKSFSHKTSWKTHQVVHTREKAFCCDVCGKTFSVSSNLYRHQRMHTGEKAFNCAVCDKHFTQVNHLKVHQRIHTGEKRFTCETCGKSFNQKSVLKSHQRVHTGEKLYICEACGRSYNSASYFSRHKLIHTGEKPYSCNECEASFSLARNLTSSANTLG